MSQLENLSFAEIGSNTGITLLKTIRKRVLKECYGYADWTDIVPALCYAIKIL